ncbi:MAG: hypothetical protein LUH51_07885 [Firmicutes bacterium]|nr:hypothetical protein [Bacillota bacterium]
MEKNQNAPKDPGAAEKQRNYELKSEAVENLAHADSEETPQYSEEELNKYRSKKGIHIPEPVKILFLKAWFPGAVCYFVLWGLSGTVGNMVDMLFILAIVQGMVTDLLTNNVIRYIEKTPGGNDEWLLVAKKGVTGFFFNLLCSMLIVLGVFFLYDFINRVAVAFTGDPEGVVLGVEPIVYGLFSMGLDMLLVGIKRLCCSIVRDAKAAAGAQ